MNIRHDTYGHVGGVTKTSGARWSKNGAAYFKSEGWEEMPEERWVEVPPHWEEGLSNNGYYLDIGQRFRCVERYDLPEDWIAEWRESGVGLDLFFRRFPKKHCLIVEERR